ncbi:MAG: FAD-dependent oxidoreductase [Clostridiales bacterium]|nr:FAD-dependent oxidoreductase [Eubacteriales bacterium]MDH7566596.1 FAD-dependent oxidoreductase [Clostridiales bacterium]
MSADVVVVGAGPAGLAAAVTAAEGGTKVIVLEKTAAIGGTGLLGAFGLLAADSKLQKEAGKKVPVDGVFKEWMDYTHWFADANIVRAYIQKSASTIDWLIAHGMDLRLSPPAQKTHMNGYWTYHAFKDYSKKPDYFKNLQTAAANKGAQFLLETPADSLITDANGNVTGVTAKKKDGTVLNISAKAVIVATGGYGGNPDMVKEKLSGDKQAVNLFGVSFTSGDGIKMAWKAGAAKGDSILQLHGTTIPPELMAKLGDKKIPDLSSVLNLCSYPYVDPAGRRFVNEDVNYDTALVANVTYAQGDHIFILLSGNMVNALMTKGARALGNYDSPARIAGVPLVPDLDKPWTGLQTDLDNAVAAGFAFKGQTLDELAKASGMDAKILTETINRYNELCKKGVDEDFKKDPKLMYPLTEGPYYAVMQRASYLTAAGGVKIDDKTEALNSKGVPIPGLYVAGNDASGLYGDSYVLLEGGTLGWAFNSGRIAGENAVKYVTAK